MATAYTSLLGLALPVTGELSGTWGDTVNNSITSLLDSAIAGTTTLSTDADVTLTTTTGASNTSRQAILLCSGARTVLRTITAPAQSKIYTIINATTGGFSVKLVGAGPTTGVTVVAGESAVCAWNGSDFIKISNTSGAGAFTTLSVTDVATFSAGTAALPAITTTGDTNTGIFFPAADTIGFSEGGVEAARIDASGNFGLGVTPSAWTTFTSAIEVPGGALAGISANQVGVWQNCFYNSSSFKYKSTAAATLYQQAGGDHVWYNAASGTAGNTISFTQAMTLNASGNLGIGITSPVGRLNVKSTYVSDATTQQRFEDTTGSALNFGGTSGGVKWINVADVATPSTGYALAFQTGGTERARIDSSGNLGLAVTPSAWNTGWVASQIGSAGCIAAIRSTTGPSVVFQNNAFLTTGSVWTYITSSPTNPATQYEQYNGNHIWYNAASGTGAITWTQAMTLDASGNLLVGTTNGYGANTRLNLLSSTNAIVANIYNSGSTSTTKLANIIQRVSSNASNADVNINFTDNVSNNYYFGGNNGGAYVMANTNGVRLSNGGTSWASDSDERLKDIIEPIINAAEKVSSLRAVIGKYKTDEEGVRRTFLIAQDVQAVLPEAVFDEQGTLMLAYTETIPLLVAAIKEQQALITTLTARITALESA